MTVGGRFVVDASVAVKWFVPEVHSVAAAKLLRRKAVLYAPELILAEFGNILWKKCRRKEVSPEEAAGILSDFRRAAMTVVPHDGLLDGALEFALSHRRSFYDSLYLSLAVSLGAPLVTADRAFYDAVAATDRSDLIVWVEDVR